MWPEGDCLQYRHLTANDGVPKAALAKLRPQLQRRAFAVLCIGRAQQSLLLYNVQAEIARRVSAELLRTVARHAPARRNAVEPALKAKLGLGGALPATPPPVEALGTPPSLPRDGARTPALASAVLAPAAPHLGLTRDAVATMAQKAARKRGRAGQRSSVVGPGTPTSLGSVPVPVGLHEPMLSADNVLELLSRARVHRTSCKRLLGRIAPFEPQPAVGASARSATLACLARRDVQQLAADFIDRQAARLMRMLRLRRIACEPASAPPARATATIEPIAPGVYLHGIVPASRALLLIELQVGGRLYREGEKHGWMRHLTFPYSHVHRPNLCEGKRRKVWISSSAPI